LGIGVAVGVSLAPYLGKVNVPGFSSLLELFPDVLRDRAIPLSTVLMAVIAAAVEFLGVQRITAVGAKKWFVRMLVLTVAFLLVLTIAHGMSVTTVEYNGGKNSASFVTGFGERPATCSTPCKETEIDCVSCNSRWANSQCIENISFRPSAIEGCFGSTRVNLANTLLLLFYLAVTSCLAALIAVLAISKARAAQT
jgi:hypothetical protein